MKEHMREMIMLVETVDSGSFTLAADKLGVSKTLISKRIKKLEEDLGVQLLNRSTRSLSLTEPGHLFMMSLAKFKKY